MQAILLASTREDSKLKILTENGHCIYEADSGAEACFQMIEDYKSRHEIKVNLIYPEDPEDDVEEEEEESEDDFDDEGEEDDVSVSGCNTS